MQILKDEIRNAIVDAALETFTAGGYALTSMAEVAKAAKISSGNIYRYFRSKEDLLHAAVPEKFVVNAKRDLKAVLSAAQGLSELIRPTAENRGYQAGACSLLLHSAANRKRLVFLLEKSADTPYESFRGEILELFVGQSLEFAKKANGGKTLSSRSKEILRLIYSAFLSSVSEILRRYQSNDEIVAMLESYRSYHLAGLKSFFEEAK